MKLYYWNGANFGDAAAPLLVQAMLGESVEYAPPFQANLYATGSILYGGGDIVATGDKRGFVANYEFLRRWFSSRRAPLLHLWGCGFLGYPNIQGRRCYLRQIKVHALRGRKTLELLWRLGFELEESAIALGDVGLLYDRLLMDTQPNPLQLYDVGLVPHVRDAVVGQALLRTFQESGLNVKLIDVCRPPVEVITEITSCRTILSSSLHGCIVADSLHIPNRHLVLSTFGYTWDNFILKFDDYYSAFGLDGDEPLHLDEVIRQQKRLPDYLENTTRLSWEAVEGRKVALARAFPKDELLRIRK